MLLAAVVAALLFQEIPATIGGRSVVVWKPAPAASKAPLVIFSHGYGGCAVQSRFLTEALARDGYFVVAPNHTDAACDRRSSGGGVPARPDAPFRDPGKWSDATFVARRDDIRAVLAGLRADTAYANHVDFERIALAGHSLGGYTILGLAGAWSSWKMSGVKAVLALSPYADPYVVHKTLNGVSAPVMFQGGTLDFGVTPSIKRSSGAYDGTPNPKYFVDLRGAGHFAWTNLRSDFHQTILDYSLAFLDHYVKGTSGAALTKQEPQVATLKYASELGAR